MDEPVKGNSMKQSRSPKVSTTLKQPTYLKVTNRSTSTDTDLSRVPKRKLSVFYRTFDVIAQIDQEKGKGPLEFRRTTSSPSVRTDGTQEDADSKNTETGQQSSLQKSGFVNNCCSLIESGKFFGTPDSSNLLGKISGSDNSGDSNAASSSPTRFKIPQIRENAIVDNYATITETSIGKHYKLNKNGNREVNANDGNVAFDSRHNDSSSSMTNTAESSVGKKIENLETGHPTNATIDHRRGNSPDTRPVCSRGVTCTDLVKIKDSEYPRSFVNPSSAGRLGKYTSVDAEMSSHEDSSIGSDSEEDSIERGVQASKCTQPEVEKIERQRSKSDNPSLRPSSSSSTGESFKKTDSSEHDSPARTEEFAEACSKREKRQRFFVRRRSLSEGDCEGYHQAKRRVRCGKEEDYFDKQEHCPAFPSFDDARLRTMGLSKVEDVESLYRENIPEEELERKYIAFSIGLCTDRITLQRRVALSLRQRNQSEQNFRKEIRKMQEDIQDLCPLCTDQESIDKVAKVRESLDMIERSVHAISCAAETLGAVYQEQRISKAIYVGDKYLQLLRSRCENLTAEISETKQILWKNNIVIEETSSEIGDDLHKIRYRNGLLGNNRTMVARRRASIAAISRPINSQDVIKEAPRCCSQRNSVSGRVTLRRPSLCSETQRWENEKINRADSANSVVELREIFEHTESRRNSTEENNNLLRIDESNSVNTANCNAASNTENKDRLISKQNSFLESNVTKTVENQIKSCIRTAEPFRLTRDIETWRPILWYTLIFFLGFYVKLITTRHDTCDVPP